MLRLALVGCGEHSRMSHAAPLAAYAANHPDQIELAAACDLNIDKASEFCRSFGFARAYTEFERMLDTEKVDACVSVMPVDHITQIGMNLLQRRIPCVIEKPLGISLHEAEHLAAAAAETQTPHMVSVNRRFMPYLNRARSWANEQGSLAYVRATQVRYARDESDFIWSTAIHVLDATRHIAGEIVNFEAQSWTERDMSSRWFLIFLDFENGAKGTIEVLPTSGMVEESYELFGEGFRARVTAGAGPQRTLDCWREDQLSSHAKASDDEPEFLRNGSYQEVEEFVSALRSGNRPHPEIKDILPSTRISFAIAELFRSDDTQK
ncbi:MAG TPA: Gfo/Idh/MocA family oxidoreductase [Pyrinomonadaceae bacterium]|nr:Gfo/Idh/MocA family oxidoreductase [Pyrinomonadaceae bacterium]